LRVSSCFPSAAASPPLVKILRKVRPLFVEGESWAPSHLLRIEQGAFGGFCLGCSGTFRSGSPPLVGFGPPNSSSQIGYRGGFHAQESFDRFLLRVDRSLSSFPNILFPFFCFVEICSCTRLFLVYSRPLRDQALSRILRECATFGRG